MLDVLGSVVPQLPPSTDAGVIRRYQKPEGNDERPSERKRLQGHTSLYSPCSEIDFDELFRKADAHFATHYIDGPVPFSERYSFSSSDGLFVLDIGDRPAQPGHCPLCAFFAAVKGPDTKGPFQLRAFSSVTCSSFLNIKLEPRHAIGMFHKAFLAVTPVDPINFNCPLAALPSSWHPIYRVLLGDSTPKPLGIWAKELEPSVNFNDVNEWLSFCKKHHRGACDLPKHQTFEALPGFRLIDCDSSSLAILEKPPTEKYAALIYVWGEEAAVSDSIWPKVVLDAILVTR